MGKHCERCQRYVGSDVQEVDLCADCASAVLASLSPASEPPSRASPDSIYAPGGSHERLCETTLRGTVEADFGKCCPAHRGNACLAHWSVAGPLSILLRKAHDFIERNTCSPESTALGSEILKTISDGVASLPAAPSRAPGDDGERFTKAAMEWCRLHSMCERMTVGSPRYEGVSLSRTLARGRMMELYAYLASRGGDASRGGGGVA